MAFNSTFRKLNIAERQSLLDSGERMAFRPGEIIIRQGVQLKGIYVVVKGEVRVEHGIQVVRQTVVKQPNHFCETSLMAFLHRSLITSFFLAMHSARRPSPG